MNGAKGAFSWWEEAGVDVFVGETPRDWLAPEAEAPGRQSSNPAAEPEPAHAPDPLPDDYARFREWLATSDQVPYAAPTAFRAVPSGEPGAAVMVMVDMPSEDDVASGRLLSGETGALFDRMMLALELRREDLYLAPLSPVRHPLGRIPRTELGRLAEIARHHINLVKPRWLLLFGATCGLALLGQTVAAARGRWHRLEMATGPVDTLVTLRPQKLLVQPNLKSLAWEDLKMLRDALSPSENDLS